MSACEDCFIRKVCARADDIIAARITLLQKIPRTKDTTSAFTVELDKLIVTYCPLYEKAGTKNIRKGFIDSEPVYGDIYDRIF